MAQYPNVIRLNDHFESRDAFYFALDLVSPETLFQHVLNSNNGQGLEIARVRDIILKIGLALNHLHQNGIVLRNLDAHGILMTESSAQIESSGDRVKEKPMGKNKLKRQGTMENVNVKRATAMAQSDPKIIHLDRSQVIGLSSEEDIDAQKYKNYTSGVYGDIRFRAPEVVDGQNYSYKADVWAFGILLFFLLSGKFPYDDIDLKGRQFTSKKPKRHIDETNEEKVKMIEEKIRENQVPMHLLKD